ncbi:MAG: hypothetical protein M0010_06735 [Actinomycetota bacterium]|nr:hypothetical protein [Actinomycetota bacterium]
MTACTCARIRIGLEVTKARNWDLDCPEHGMASIWWNSPEQVERRREQNERLRDLQRPAARGEEPDDRSR